MNKNYKEVIKQLKILRKKQKLKIVDVAKISELSKHEICNIENLKYYPKLGTLYEYIKAINCNIEIHVNENNSTFIDTNL